MSAYTIVKTEDTTNPYDGSDVPGEFRSFGKLLHAEQLGISLIKIPARSDFDQSTGHYHDEIEEVYIITKGTLTMRFGNEIVKVHAGSAVRVAPKTPRSHRNEGDEPVEMWAVSQKLGHGDATKIDSFWAPSPDAKQRR